jgi:putative transposase
MAHHRRYGAPRIHAALRAEGHTASRGRVERLMRHHDIRAITPPRFRVCIIDSHHDLLIAPNRLGQKFAAGRPNQAWLANIIYLTYVPTGEGWLYLAAVLDLFTRKIVGWAMRDHMRAELTTAALTMAIPAAKAAYRPDPPFRSRQPIRRRRLSQGSRRSRNDSIHEPERQLPAMHRSKVASAL